MSTVAISHCSCDTFGAPKEIRQCPEHFHYWLGDRRMDSATGIINRLMPGKYDDVDLAVLANASLKGKCIDAYFSELLSGEPMIPLADFKGMIEDRFIADRYKTPAQHADDAETRLLNLINWWDVQGWKAVAVQEIVFSEKDGVAYRLDVATEDMLLDLKCVSKLQPSYALQLGAGLSMDKQRFPLRDAAILHVTKDAVKLVRYDGKKCKEQWRSALAWYRTHQELIGT